jgi:hypothetical protein
MVEFEVDSRENSSVDESLVKLKLIQLELREVVANLHEKIEIIESEPLQKIRLDVESKANSLEAEVKRLREDIFDVDIGIFLSPCITIIVHAL